MWFDAEGNLVESDTADIPRSTIPGDPIRFVGHAPTEECRDFALILHMASQKSDAVASGDDDDEQADEAAEAEAKVEAEEVAEEAETLAGESYVIPEVKEQNISGDANDVKVIGVSDTGSEE